MPTKDMLENKERYANHKKEIKHFSNDLNKHHNKEKFDKEIVRANDKAKGINYYNSLSESEKLVFQRELQKKEIREDYAKYLKYVYKDNYTITKYHMLLIKICEKAVDLVEHNKRKIICLSVPPQTGKSMTVTESLPSWFLGRNPDLRCILTAYNGDIAEKFGDKNRQKVKDFGKDIFGIEISDRQDNKTLWDIKGHQGGLYSAGILGGLTSNGGALIIVDDPFKNGEEANNKTIRDRVWEIFGDTVSTRVRIEGAVTIVIHTRWHEDDLIGRIMKAELGNEVICVNLPAIWEKGEDKLMHRRIGETLVPERGMTTDFLEKQKKLLGIRKFYALYQGMPFVDGGEIVKRDYFKFYTKASLPSVFEEITMSCDLSFGSTKNSFDDPCGIGIFGRVGGNHYLLEYIIKKLSFTDTLERIRYFCGKYPMMKKKLIEAKANGNATIEILNREIGGFVAYNPKESKEERLNLCLPFFEAGNVFFPSEEIDKNIEEQIQVFLRFPKVTHEEIVDITTQYLLNYQYKYSGKLNTDKRYSQLAKAIRGFRV